MAEIENIEEGKWNDRDGAGLSSTLSTMLESLEIIGDAEERLLFHGLMVHWRLSCLYLKAENDN